MIHFLILIMKIHLFLIQIGCILGGTSYILAEINHPGSSPVNVYFSISFGIILGILQTIATIWGAYIKPTLIISAVATIINIFLMSYVSNRLEYFPMATTALSYSITLTILLGVYFAIIEAADRNIKGTLTMEKAIVRFFPKGHPNKL